MGSRKPTKGPPVSFRLSIADHALLESRAARHGESPGEYVRRSIETALEAIRVPADTGSLRPSNVAPSRPGYRRRHP